MSGARIRIAVADAEVAIGLRRLSEAGGDLLVSTRTWVAAATLQRMPARRRIGQPTRRDTGRRAGRLVFEAGAESVEIGSHVASAGIDRFGGALVIPERKGSATFEYVAEGAGKAKDGRRVGSRLRFATASTRAKTKHTRAFTVPAHTVSIPARPYLGVSDDDRAEILAILADRLAKAGAEGAP